jgi:predicted transcriptional regulator
MIYVAGSRKCAARRVVEAQRAVGRNVDTKQQNLYCWGMDMVPLSPERKAQLDDYAQRHGQDTAAALDDALATYLEWERQDYREAVGGIRQGYADFQAGRIRPAEEAFEELREKHGLPR